MDRPAHEFSKSASAQRVSIPDTTELEARLHRLRAQNERLASCLKDLTAASQKLSPTPQPGGAESGRPTEVPHGLLAQFSDELGQTEELVDGVSQIAARLRSLI